MQKRIEREGWGVEFLSRRGSDGHWGERYYQPKWTSSHYTLLDLKVLQISPEQPAIKETVHKIFTEEKGTDGGIDPSKTIGRSDVCVCGMMLGCGAYFKEAEKHLASVVDFILSQQLPDGGFNCRNNRSGAVHSSLHSTLSVIEGVLEYAQSGYTYRLQELETAAAESREFIFRHRLYKSDKTGKIIHPELLKLSFPPRWKYNILRSLDYFRAADVPKDKRMDDALTVLIKKRRADGKWPLQAKHPGKTHFDMEDSRGPSRWNTLLALRVLKKYDPE